MICVVQEWLSSDQKAKASVVVELTRLDVSAVLIWHWSPRETLESCQSSIYVGTPKI